MIHPPHRSPSRTRRLVVALSAAAVVLAACGSDADDSADGTPTTLGSTDTGAETTDVVSDDTTATPDPTDAVTATSDSTESTTTDATETTESPTSSADVDGAEVEVPERVVSLSPTHTEIMFAIGADDLLVAVDDFSNFPAEALELPNDLSAFEPDVEAITAYQPDLVLISGAADLAEQLRGLDIEVWEGPAAATFDDAYVQIEQLGALTGHVGDAAELVSSMQTRIDELAAAVPELDEPLSYYHELTPELYSSTSSTFIGEVYGLFGLENIADAADGGDYPQLSAEFVIGADPDLVFLADSKCCSESAETFAAREGFDQIAAVRNGAVILLDDDIPSRWGPRIVDFVEIVADSVATVVPADA